MSEHTDDSIQEIGIPVLEMEVEPSNEVQWPVDATLSIPEEAADAKAVGDAVNDLQASIAELSDEIQHVTSVNYPVGIIIMTTSAEAPDFEGVWVEVAITATWAQLKTGKRDYETLEEGDTGGLVHFWMRTE